MGNLVDADSLRELIFVRREEIRDDDEVVSKPGVIADMVNSYEQGALQIVRRFVSGDLHEPHARDALQRLMDVAPSPERNVLVSRKIEVK